MAHVPVGDIPSDLLFFLSSPSQPNKQLSHLIDVVLLAVALLAVDPLVCPRFGKQITYSHGVPRTVFGGHSFPNSFSL